MFNPKHRKYSNNDIILNFNYRFKIKIYDDYNDNTTYVKISYECIKLIHSIKFLLDNYIIWLENKIFKLNINYWVPIKTI